MFSLTISFSQKEQSLAVLQVQYNFGTNFFAYVKQVAVEVKIFVNNHPKSFFLTALPYFFLAHLGP